jgi:N-acetylneuraminic acid mutarotase
MEWLDEWAQSQAQLGESGPMWLGPVPSTGAIPQARGGHTATAVDHKIFVFGGSAYNNKTTGAKEMMGPLSLVQEDLHIYNIVTNTWTKVSGKGTPPSPRYAHSSTRVGKKIIIFGGFNGTRYLDDLYILDTGNF